MGYQNLRITSWTNYRLAIFGTAKDIYNGDRSLYFLGTDNDLLRQIAAVHHLKIVQEGTLEQWVPSGLLVVFI